MPKYEVREVTEIKTTYVVEANSSTAAVNKIKNQKNIPNTYHSLEQHFVSRELEEEITDDKQQPKF